MAQDVTRKEAYESFFEKVKVLKAELLRANTEDAVNKALEGIDTLMNDARNDSQLKDLHNWVAETSSLVQSVKLHVVTKMILDNLLYQILEEINKIFEEEKKNAYAAQLRELFLEMAEHAPEIAEIIGGCPGNCNAVGAITVDVNHIFD